VVSWDPEEFSLGPVSMSKMLTKAKMGKYGVGYFESWNLESTRAVLTAANEERSPVIIGFNGTILEQHGCELEYYAAVGSTAVEKAQVPVVLILNEASSFDQIVKGIRCGFSSVMIDGSSMSLEDNVKLTRKVVEVAHSVDVSVEAQFDELPHAIEGVLPKKVAKDSMTDPRKAHDFVKQTGIDALSVSVGNVHVLYKQQVEIDCERVRMVAEAVGIPLVVHGATGIKDDSIKKAIEAGISKVNIGTALRSVFTAGMRKAFANTPLVGPEEVLDSGELELKGFVKKKMKAYASSGKAKS
jgi:ketose-bisphosphate aldolase